MEIMKKSVKKNYYGYKLVLFSLTYLAGGYTLHNTLTKIVDARGVDRVNDCYSTKSDVMICMNYFQPRGWEKLVRF
jgi:hypothetical protein